MNHADPPHGKQTASDTARPPRPGRHQALLAVLRTVMTTTGLVLGYYLLPMDTEFSAGSAVGLIVGLMAMLALFVWQIRRITSSPAPRLRAVEALSTTLPLFLLLFAAAYYLLGRSTSGSFSESLSRTDSLYFTLTVFSTVGFGDITAVTHTARVLTMAQMTGDILLVGVAARVVAGAVQAGLQRKEERDR
ncbi:potassium channel family protein [Streptomyces sp. NPDC058307]|uniref:potassium channel family protein n=1 Tax=Streptomyces sp. NPDC058307 TaxID=3346439 RepID=UPI0036E6E659